MKTNFQIIQQDDKFLGDKLKRISVIKYLRTL